MLGASMAAGHRGERSASQAASHQRTTGERHGGTTIALQIGIISHRSAGTSSRRGGIIASNNSEIIALARRRLRRGGHSRPAATGNK